MRLHVSLQPDGSHEKAEAQPKIQNLVRNKTFQLAKRTDALLKNSWPVLDGFSPYSECDRGFSMFLLRTTAALPTGLREAVA